MLYLGIAYMFKGIYMDLSDTNQGQASSSESNLCV